MTQVSLKTLFSHFFNIDPPLINETGSSIDGGEISNTIVDIPRTPVSPLCVFTWIFTCDGIWWIETAFVQIRG